jgi:hypothetical protein
MPALIVALTSADQADGFRLDAQREVAMIVKNFMKAAGTLGVAGSP